MAAKVRSQSAHFSGKLVILIGFHLNENLENFTITDCKSDSILSHKLVVLTSEFGVLWICFNFVVKKIQTHDLHFFLNCRTNDLDVVAHSHLPLI